MSEPKLRIEVLETFAELTHAIQQLCQAITLEDNLTSWVAPSEGSALEGLIALSHRERACQVIRQLEYTAKQAPREIIVCPGFIGASSSTINLATVLNERKDSFKKSILALKEAKIPHHDPHITEKINSMLARPLPTSLTLKKVGLARLHLKQCYRKIPILPFAAEKISWTWAHTRSIKKITVEKAHELLIKKGNDPGIQAQLQKLKHLPSNEPLAIVQELAPHLRANIVYPKTSAVQRQMIKGPIPILFPADEATPAPYFKPPTEKKEKSVDRVQRSDVRLEPTPFLSALRAHRYAVLEE